MIVTLICPNRHCWEAEVDRDIGVLCFVDDDAMFCPECGEAGTASNRDSTRMEGA